LTYRQRVKRRLERLQTDYIVDTTCKERGYNPASGVPLPNAPPLCSYAINLKEQLRVHGAFG
jgi:hypothetical protein